MGRVYGAEDVFLTASVAEPLTSKVLIEAFGISRAAALRWINALEGHGFEAIDFHPGGRYSGRPARGIIHPNGRISTQEIAQIVNDTNGLLPPGEMSRNILYAAYRAGAQTRNLPFDLTKEQFGEITSQPCHYCGLEPQQVFQQNKGDIPYIYNGIDRVHNEQGYVIENCVPCCMMCNRAKGSMPLDRFMAWIERIVNHWK